MKKHKLGLLSRLLLGIVCGMLLGSLGDLLHMQDNPAFVGMVRVFATFTTLFSTFVYVDIRLLLISFD